jgi:F-type H+/Na+-transporting ATPase subunit alpha
MGVSVAELSELFRRQIESFDKSLAFEETGTVISVGDGIARVAGVEQVMAGELIEFPHGVKGLTLNLEEDNVGVALFGEVAKIREGDRCRRTGKVASGPGGRRARASPSTARAIESTERPIEVKAPGIVAAAAGQGAAADRHQGHRLHDPHRPRPARAHHRRPPDRQDRHPSTPSSTRRAPATSTASTSPSARSARPSPRWSRSSPARRHGLHTIVAATASEPAPLQFIAPYAGCAMGEYFRDNGKHALIIYDDLSKHAQAYRQLSLLLRRPPGREAYPGDVFYLHSRLLERAAKLSDDELGGGSLTALPIIETQAGDVSAYIPTNVISITDGQIYLETDLFFSGSARPSTSASR